MRSRSVERARASASPSYSPPSGSFEQLGGNAAIQDQLNRASATPARAPERVARPPSDAEQVALAHEVAAGASDTASSKRAALDAKLATMQATAAPHLACRSAAFWELRSALGSSLPTSIGAKSDIVDSLGFPQGEVGGVGSRVLRAPADPTRPQLVAFAGESGQEALQEKLAGFKKERTKGELGRAFSGLLQGSFSMDREVVPAMSILFDGSGLDAGIAEANEQLGGEQAKDLMAGVATAEALKKAKGRSQRLEKAATGRGLGGRIANRVFRNSLPDARAQVRGEGAKSRAEVADYVTHEARAQLLTQKANVEEQMVDAGLGLDKVGLGAVFDRKDTHLDPDTLNLFLQTKEGGKFWLEDIGGESTYAEADKLEAATSPLHAKGELDNAALSRVSAKYGLYPTQEGGFFRVPADLEPARQAEVRARLQAAYATSEGQPLPASVLRHLAK
ncbi:MAG: hypothetical protein H6737_04855 [Alphaproteobacteria bacterium]|nr:hypothetical protein [Alphaproteobacteria bacterium]